MKRNSSPGLRSAALAFWWVALLFLASQATAASAPTFDWFGTSFSALSERGGAVAVDRLGNVVWVYPSSGYTQGEDRRLVVKKFSGEGQLLWSNTSIRCYGLGVVLAAVANDGSLTFFSSSPVSSYPGGVSGYLGKFSSSGAFLWGDPDRENLYRYTITTNAPFGGGAAASPSGNTVFALPYTHFSFGGRVLSSEDPEMVVVAIGPSGSVVWLKSVVGPGHNTPTGVIVDADANTYVCGHNAGLAAFDAITVPSRGGADGFIAKYNVDGNVLWILTPACTSDDKILGMAMAPDGMLWCYGTFSGSITLGTQTLTGSGTYLASLNSDGAFTSASKLPSGISVTQIQAAPDASLILAGKLSGTTLGSLTVANQGMDDVFVANFSQSGTPLWAKTMGYIYADTPGGLAVSPSGEIYVTGTVQGGGVFDEQFIPGSGNEDAFLAKLASQPIPQFTESPASTNVFRGSAVTFTSAVAPGTAVTYQWFFNNAPIPLATGPTYTIPSVSTTNQGYYFVEVTNEAGTVRSASAQLSIRGQLPIRVTTIAGTNVPGYLDANTGPESRFNSPNGLAHWSGGLMVVADSWNHLIRMFDPNGAVGTYAGRNVAGYSNAPAHLAQFSHPLGLAVEPSLDVLVADTENNVIRRVSSFGLRQVTTVAGNGERGYLDGPALQARFDYPNDLAVDARGNIFVTEWQNHTVRRIDPTGTVSTFAGDGTPGSANGVGPAAKFKQPGGLTVDSAGNLYVTEWGGHRVRRIATNGLVTTVAGTGNPGLVDGIGNIAQFNQPDGIALDPLGNLYLTEAGNHTIRKIDPSGVVTTVAGLGTPGLKDGDAETALFNLPSAIAWHPTGSIYVSDFLNHPLRRIDFLTDGPSPEAAALLITLNPTLTIFGQPGSTYRIEAAEATTSPLDWTVLDTITLTTSAAFWCDPQPATRNQRIFRAVKVN